MWQLLSLARKQKQRVALACQETFWGKFLYEQIEDLDSEYLNPLWEVVPKTSLATEVAQPLDGRPQLTVG